MTHPLDNPAWSALHSRQAYLATGSGLALRYARDHAVFAAVAHHDAPALAALGALVAETGRAIVIEQAPLPPVPHTRVETHRMAVQMLAEQPAPPERDLAFVELGDADAPEMLALATLTEPGPFFEKTHRLGTFIGVREGVGGRLIAMAGERMQLDGFVEVSGVCTHPDHRGHGLAGALMRIVAAQIVARGDLPFLHAYADNRGAIALYESLGYRIRCDINVSVLSPA